VSVRGIVWRYRLLRGIQPKKEIHLVNESVFRRLTPLSVMPHIPKLTPTQLAAVSQGPEFVQDFERIAVAVDQMSPAKRLVKSAVEIGPNGLGKLMAHVADGTFKWDGSKLWHVQNCIWSVVKGDAEKQVLTDFVQRKVIPFARANCPIGVEKTDIARFTATMAAIRVFRTNVAVPGWSHTMDDENLVAFEDGFYDLENGHFVRYEDDDDPNSRKFTRTVGYPFPTKEGPYHAEVFRFFEEVHPDPSVRNFFLQSLAGALHGRCRNSHIMVWHGSGANGKSLTNQLVAATWGGYAMDLHSAYLQRPTAFAGPDVLTMEMRGRRLILSSEPANGKRLHSDTIKSMTGGDKARARGLYEGSTMSFQRQIQLNIMCNMLPPIDGADGGVARRIVVIPFEATFSNNPRPGHSLPANHGLLAEITKWGPSFMYILLSGVYTPDWNGQMPDKIRDASTGYLHANNIYAAFRDQYYRQDDNANGITTREVANDFQRWKKDNVPRSHIGRNTLIELLDVAFTGRKLTRNQRRITRGGDRLYGWTGWTRKENPQEVPEFESEAENADDHSRRGDLEFASLEVESEVDELE